MTAGWRLRASPRRFNDYDEGRHHPMAQHGDPAAVPEAAVLGLVHNLKGVPPNTSSVGVTWNAEDWSMGS